MLVINFYNRNSIDRIRNKTKQARLKYPDVALNHIFKLINKRAAAGYLFAIHDFPSWVKSREHRHILETIEVELENKGFTTDYIIDEYKVRLQIYWA